MNKLFKFFSEGYALLSIHNIICKSTSDFLKLYHTIFFNFKTILPPNSVLARQKMSGKSLVSGTSHDNSAPRQRAVFWKFTKWRSGLFRNSKNKFQKVKSSVRMMEKWKKRLKKTLSMSKSSSSSSSSGSSSGSESEDRQDNEPVPEISRKETA